jgi:murein DD-endopeptidase MepM/ murein hydrolase activator NlpD
MGCRALEQRLYFGAMVLHQLVRLGAFVLVVIPCGARAQVRNPAATPRLTVEPRQPSGGSLIRLTIDRGSRHVDASDSVVRIVGHVAGEQVHFVPASNGRHVALGAIPVDVSDSVVAQAMVRRQSGNTDTLRVVLRYPHRVAPISSRGRAPGARRLRVDARFTRPLDAETEKRVERENQLARDVGRRAHETPQMWTYPFLRPRAASVTSRFGTGRVFNGRVASSHLGVDYRGKVGDPIVATNRGIVALVAEFFLAGNVVYIDHGSGVVTGYFHMSESSVAKGDTVERGQEIGRVGSTGRVTGPHLHWSARFGALTIDPAGLLALSAPFAAPDTARRKATTNRIKSL